MAARTAIRYNSQHGNTQTLRHDLKQGPYHVFGLHDDCRDYFCKKKGKDDNLVPVLEQCGMWPLILVAINRIIQKADRLSAEETSNRAELYMSLVAKYSAGKRLNLVARDNFNRRCTVAALQYQKGHIWHRSPYKKCFDASPGRYFKKHMEDQLRRHPKSKVRRRLHFGANKKALTDSSYGEEAQDYLCDEELRILCEQRLLNLKVKTWNLKYLLLKYFRDKIF